MYCAISFQDSLPLHDYFAVVDDHFDVRRHLIAMQGDMADRAQQYRAVQKRLLMRFKDQAAAGGGKGGGGSAAMNQKLRDLNLLQVTTHYSVV